MNKNDFFSIVLLICGVAMALLFMAMILGGCSAEQGRVIGTEIGDGISRFATGYAETYESIQAEQPVQEHGFRTVFVNGQPVFVNY